MPVCLSLSSWLPFWGRMPPFTLLHLLTQPPEHSSGYEWTPHPSEVTEILPEEFRIGTESHQVSFCGGMGWPLQPGTREKQKNLFTEREQRGRNTDKPLRASWVLVPATSQGPTAFLLCGPTKYPTFLIIKSSLLKLAQVGFT